MRNRWPQRRDAARQYPDRRDHYINPLCTRAPTMYKDYANYRSLLVIATVRSGGGVLIGVWFTELAGLAPLN